MINVRNEKCINLTDKRLFSAEKMRKDFVKGVVVTGSTKKYVIILKLATSLNYSLPIPLFWIFIYRLFYKNTHQTNTLLNAYYVPDTVPSTIHLISTSTLRDGQYCCYLHLTDSVLRH